MNKPRRILLFLVLAAIAGVIFYLQSVKPPRPSSGNGAELTPRASMAEKEQRYPVAREIANSAGFINTEKIAVGDLIGKKVILVDFWTYSCINCQRTTPYLNAWYEKYRDQGLEIIGVHTPEFAFEREYTNVLKAVERFGIEYPVVLDNDYATWTAYENRYWPRKYLIDIDGFIVYDHIGEGAYEETERKIQELLEERMAVLGKEGSISADIAEPRGVSDTDFSQPKSPEIYFGAARNEYLGNGVQGALGVQKFSEPGQISPDTLYLSGNWNLEGEFAENRTAAAKIIFRYRAKNVYFVAGSENGTAIKIMKDGKLIGSQIVKEHTLYNLIQDSDYGEHTLEIIIEKPGLRAFTFTFG